VRPAALEAANIKNARTIILASQNDSMNLQIALKARSMNPDIKVVIRIFDEDFAHALQEQFGFIALSATEMAAPVFAASARAWMSPIPFRLKVNCSASRALPFWKIPLLQKKQLIC